MDFPVSRRWIIALSILPLAAIVALILMLALRGEAEKSAPQIPGLGAQNRELPPAQTPKQPEDSDETATDPATGPDGETDKPEDTESSADFIDAVIGRLAHATRAGDRRGREREHGELRKLRPSERVNERLQSHLGGEVNAWVRIEFFKAFHGREAALAWALRVLDTRTSQFMGTTEQYQSGEVEELLMYAEAMLPLLFEPGPRDERLLGLVRNAINTERPQWLLHSLLLQLLSLHHATVREGAFATPRDSIAGLLSDDLKQLLLRETAPEADRAAAFWLWLTSLPDWNDALSEIEQTALVRYLPLLVQVFPSRAESRLPLMNGMEALAKLLERAPIGRAWLLHNAEAVSSLCARMLQGRLDADVKRALIAAVSLYRVPGGRDMLEAGLAKRDEFFATWLVALGRMAESDADLQRLTVAANNDDVATAQGAIEGLRVSPLPGADAELRGILEHGANIGVKSQALGAMLDRATDKAALLEEYLDPNKDASLRAVAVAHVPAAEPARLQRVVEEDTSLRVRQAALTRLGDLKDKSLRPWFLRMANRDASPLLRQQARGYADELRD